jgi:hypothetical protein
MAPPWTLSSLLIGSMPFNPPAPDQLWVADFERREALFNRVEVEDLHHTAVAAAG